MNETLSSLRSIHLLWHPQTIASFEERMEVVDAIRDDFPDAGWALMRSIIPTSHDIASPTSKPQWRDWSAEPPTPKTYSELGRQVSAVIDRMLADAKNVPSRWRDLVGLIDSVSREDRQRVVDALSSTEFKGASEEVIQLWASLRRLIAHHWEFPDADWALPDEEVGHLFDLYESLSPTDSLLRFTWLFESVPDLPIRGLGSDFAAREDAASDFRASAVRDVLHEGGIEGVLDLARRAPIPWLVGQALADSISDREIARLLGSMLDTGDPRLTDVVQGFLQQVLRSSGEASLREILLDTPAGATHQRAEVYLALPFDPSTWDMLQDEPEEVGERYWSRTWPFGRGKLTPTVVRRAAAEFLDHSQTVKAIDLLALYRDGVPADLALRALKALSADPPADPAAWQRMGYDLVTLLDAVSASGGVERDELTRLEWFFLPVLSRVHYGYRPPTLDRALAEDPDFFVEVLKTTYRSRGEDESEPSEEERARAQQGFELLFKWASLPGASGENVDAEALEAWVMTVRERAQAAELIDVADVHIGNALSHSPDGSDGLWPHEAVRDVIESLANETIERGFATQVYNNRGVTSRGIGEGGLQERELSQRYRTFAMRVRGSWPRTGSVLERIARGYESDARREDERAAEDRLRWE